MRRIVTAATLAAMLAGCSERMDGDQAGTNRQAAPVVAATTPARHDRRIEDRTLAICSAAMTGRARIEDVDGNTASVAVPGGRRDCLVDGNQVLWRNAGETGQHAWHRGLTWTMAGDAVRIDRT